MLLQDSCHENIIAGWSQLAIREQLESTGSAGMMASTWASQWLSQLQCQAIYFMYWTAISFWFQYRLWNTNLCVPQSFYHFFLLFWYYMWLLRKYNNNNNPFCACFVCVVPKCLCTKCQQLLKYSLCIVWFFFLSLWFWLNCEITLKNQIKRKHKSKVGLCPGATQLPRDLKQEGPSTSRSNSMVFFCCFFFSFVFASSFLLALTRFKVYVLHKLICRVFGCFPSTARAN